MVKEEGSHKRWNEIWQKSSKAKRGSYDLSMLFTKGEPKNIFEFWQKAYYEDLKQLVQKYNYQSFLELGSGRGTTSMYLVNDGFTDVTMLDIAPNSFELARKNFAQTGLPLPEMIIADVMNTKLPDQSYDCIFNIGLLEHFENPKPVLEEAYRLLKPNGSIFMPIFPDMPHAHSLSRRLIFNPFSAAKFIVKKLINHRSLHYKRKDGMIRTNYGADYYEKLMSEIGYSQFECIPYNSYWKVNKNKWVEENITLPAYKYLYAKKMKDSNGFRLHCKAKDAFSLLLTGFKK